MKRHQWLMWFGIVFLACVLCAQADPPTLIDYQGKILVDDIPLTGPGYFKYAIGNESGSTNFWSQDGTTSGEPATFITNDCYNGVFSSVLGGPPMGALDPAVFALETSLYLRVWFSSDGIMFDEMLPSQHLLSAPYAINSDLLDGLHADDVISAATNAVVETDPVFVASDAHGISLSDIADWDGAYNWGDHATAGYVLKSGDTMTGDLTVPGAFTASGPAVFSGDVDFTPVTSIVFPTNMPLYGASFFNPVEFLPGAPATFQDSATFLGDVDFTPVSSIVFPTNMPLFGATFFNPVDFSPGAPATFQDTATFLGEVDFSSTPILTLPPSLSGITIFNEGVSFGSDVDFSAVPALTLPSIVSGLTTFSDGVTFWNDVDFSTVPVLTLPPIVSGMTTFNDGVSFWNDVDFSAVPAFTLPPIVSGLTTFNDGVTFWNDVDFSAVTVLTLPPSVTFQGASFDSLVDFIPGASVTFQDTATFWGDVDLSTVPVLTLPPVVMFQGASFDSLVDFIPGASVTFQDTATFWGDVDLSTVTTLTLPPAVMFQGASFDSLVDFSPGASVTFHDSAMFWGPVDLSAASTLTLPPVVMFQGASYDSLVDFNPGAAVRFHDTATFWGDVDFSATPTLTLPSSLAGVTSFGDDVSFGGHVDFSATASLLFPPLVTLDDLELVEGMASPINMKGYGVTNIGNDSLVFADGETITSTKVQTWDAASVPQPPLDNMVYVATNGTSSGPGTIERPFDTPQNGYDFAAATYAGQSATLVIAAGNHAGLDMNAGNVHVLGQSRCSLFILDITAPANSIIGKQRVENVIVLERATVAAGGADVKFDNSRFDWGLTILGSRVEVQDCFSVAQDVPAVIVGSGVEIQDVALYNSSFVNDSSGSGTVSVESNVVRLLVKGCQIANSSSSGPCVDDQEPGPISPTHLYTHNVLRGPSPGGGTPALIDPNTGASPTITFTQNTVLGDVGLAGHSQFYANNTVYGRINYTGGAEGWSQAGGGAGLDAAGNTEHQVVFPSLPASWLD